MSSFMHGAGPLYLSYTVKLEELERDLSSSNPPFSGATPDGSARFADVDGGDLRPQAKTRRTQALSVGADAGAFVPLQPRLRGLWKDSVSAAHLEEKSQPGRMLSSGRTVRHPYCCAAGRRAANASPDS